MLVVGIEGIDGSGKSTLARWLYGRLRGMGWRVDLLAEPWDGVPSTLPAWDAESQARYYWADRKRMYEDCEYRVEGLDVLLLDGTYHRTLAHQGAGMGLGVDVAFEVGGVGGGYFEPDVLVVLDVPLGVAWSRHIRRGGRQFDWEYLGRVRGYYRSLEGREGVIFARYPVDKGWILDSVLSWLVEDSRAFTNSDSITDPLSAEGASQ